MVILNYYNKLVIKNLILTITELETRPLGTSSNTG